MSTLTGKQDLTVLKSVNDLAGYFQRFSKASQDRKIGIEAEFLGVDRQTGKAISYEGPQGVEKVLQALAKARGYVPILESNHVIGLRHEKTLISLEPGAQLELSAPPLANLCDFEELLSSFFNDLKKISPQFPDIAWLSVGIQPFSQLSEISWVPKARYALMKEYFGSRGSLAHPMMKKTATNQMNFDYTSEEDAMDMLRTAFLATSIASALFANSSFSSGKPNGYKTRRLEIWNHTDSLRAGLLKEFMESGKSFQDYLEYVLKLPVIFIVRGSRWMPIQTKTFQEFIQTGHESERATWSDFELHLSTAFPEVRLKQYLEVRGMDAQPWNRITAISAFWKGLLYDSQARKSVQKLLSFSKSEDFIDLHLNIPKQGLTAKLAGQLIRPLAGELLAISKEGLIRQGECSGCHEEKYVQELYHQLIESGKTEAESLAAWWEGLAVKSPQAFISRLEIPRTHE